MPGTDGVVGVADSTTPTKYVDNQQVGTSGGVPVMRQRVSSYIATGLVPLVFDEIDMTWNGDGSLATATYKAGGVQVGLLTFTYASGNLQSVVRT